MNPARTAPAKPSLRALLLRRVMVPLVLTWAVGSAIALAVASHFAGQAFDRSLLDDAYALAAQVRVSPQGLVVNLTPRELSTLLFDQSESVYLAVYDASGQLATGNADLPPPPQGDPSSFRLSDLTYRGRELRAVSLRRGEPTEFTVVMAQTTTSRSLLLRRMLGYSAVPQLLLLMFLAWQLRRVIKRDLEPLAQLQQAVNQRDASDLRPVPAAVTEGASTSDVERLGMALNSMLSRLELSIAAQREFAGNVAHELRTPLAGIRAQAGYALAQADPAIWREQLLGIAQVEQRASHLVDQLLALARAGEGSAGVRMQEIELNALARNVLLRFLPKADSLGVDLGGEGLDEPARVRGDPALIEGMLGNLLDNALQYGAVSSPQVTVSVLCQGDQVVLSVTDNGPGLGGQDPARLGERWAQGPAGQRLGQGAGLGLAIVVRYAELLGAAFLLEPATDGGLRAVLRFDAAPPASSQPTPAPEASAAA